MTHQVVTVGRYVVFTGTLDQCTQYMKEVNGHTMGFWVDRIILRCRWCRWPLHAHCCKTREDMPKTAEGVKP